MLVDETWDETREANKNVHRRKKIGNTKKAMDYLSARTDIHFNNTASPVPSYFLAPKIKRTTSIIITFLEWRWDNGNWKWDNEVKFTLWGVGQWGLSRPRAGTMIVLFFIVPPPQCKFSSFTTQIVPPSVY